MKQNVTLLYLISGLILAGCSEEKASETQITKPNIIYFVADDLGYGEVGSYGQQITDTPNMDVLPPAMFCSLANTLAMPTSEATMSGPNVAMFGITRRR